MEDPRHKKKDIWKRITQGLQNACFDFTQVKVEGEMEEFDCLAQNAPRQQNKNWAKEKNLLVF